MPTARLEQVIMVLYNMNMITVTILHKVISRILSHTMQLLSRQKLALFPSVFKLKKSSQIRLIFWS